MKRLLLALPFRRIALVALVATLSACSSADTLTAPPKSLTAPSVIAMGFDEFGYNDVAGIFNGTGSSWCLAGGQAADCMGAYSSDKLIMKWNKAWTTCNAIGTPEACAGAWTDNEWNGAFDGGSGAVWHYKIKWSADCANNVALTDGGYCVWGSYEVLMDQGQDPSFGPGHLWFANAKPNGYGK